MDFKNFISDIESRKKELSESLLSNELLSCMKQLEKALNASCVRVNVIKEDRLFGENKSPFYAMCGMEIDLLEHDKKKDAKIEKYKEAFENAKCERNKAVCGYQNEIDRLKSRVQELEEYQEDLPFESIKIAEYLIDRTIEVKNTFPALQGGETSIAPVHDISELRQIAEHLLVYCKHAEGE